MFVKGKIASGYGLSKLLVRVRGSTRCPSSVVVSARVGPFGLRLQQQCAEANPSLVQIRGAHFGVDALSVRGVNLWEEAQERLKEDPDDEVVWEALTCVYCQLRRVSAELLLLSENTIGERVAWLEPDEEIRREMTDRILFARRVPTFDGKWAEVHCD